MVSADVCGRSVHSDHCSAFLTDDLVALPCERDLTLDDIDGVPDLYLRDLVTGYVSGLSPEGFTDLTTIRRAPFTRGSTGNARRLNAN